MPRVGQAPAVIPIPELSDRERQDRLQDMEKVTKRHTGIRAKIAKVIPVLDDLIQEHLRLQHDCETSPPIRAIRLARRIGTSESLKTVVAAKFHLNQLIRGAEKSARHIEAAQREVLEPDIPGVSRDLREMREVIRKKSKTTKKSQQA